MFKFVHEDEDFKVTLEVGENVITHDKVAEYFGYFLRGCGFVFDSLSQYKLVHEDGSIEPSYEEKLSMLRKYRNIEDNEEDDYTFPVV